MLRTHTCGELGIKNVDEEAVICGWVDSIRIQGKIGFLSLRDRYGITQIFLNPELAKKALELRKESVVKIKGKVKGRPQKQINPHMATGEIELEAVDLEILNESKPLPMEMDEKVQSTEETRLKYRYIDLRRENMKNNIITRHKTAKAIRDFMDKHNFLEIETPMLAKSTPEGARDYLVPSRIYPGNFYALPQSPQLFKQLLMVSGFDRYFQIVRCFRDEDLRADRGPEFTQLDIEMSFVEEEDIFSLMEHLMKYVFKTVLDVEIKIPFHRMNYADAMEQYKTDKPDLRKNPEDKNEFAFVWIYDFPLIEYSREEAKYVAVHHPFTSPKPEDLHLLETDPEKARARAYDLVLNGTEIGGGSIRIHKNDIQKKMFKVLGINEKEAEEKFGFLLEAFKYGAPPHGGIAFGFDRIVTLMTGNDSIKEVMAFPKSKDAKDLMLDAPSKVSEKQLDELHLNIKK